MNNKFMGFSSGEIGNNSGVAAVYRAFATNTVSHNPDVTSDTQVDDMAVSFNLGVAAYALVEFDLRAKKSGGGGKADRFRVYDGATQVAPVNETGFNGWYSLENNESDGKLASFSTIVNLAPGEHTVSIKWQASGSTSEVLFYDRMLAVAVLGAL